MIKEQGQYIKSLYMQIIKEEQQLRDKPMPKLTREDFFLYHETGNRLVYENAYFGRRKYLTVYAILALWSREFSRLGMVDGKIKDSTVESYIGRLGDILSGICYEEQFWALPAHIDFDKIDQPETKCTIDLFAAETAQALSEITLRLYGQLPCEVVICVVREVIERVLLPFVSSGFPYSWWETDRCNWSAVCAGSIGMAALNIDALNHKIMSDYLMDDTNQDSPVCNDVLQYRDCFKRLPDGWKADCLQRVRDALQCYLDGMEADGACTEGLGYYNYGMSFYAAFADQYAECFGADAEQLMYRDKCEQIALFQQKCYFASRFGKGISISFSDGSKQESFLPGLTAYLKHCYPQVQTPDYTLARPFDEDACYRYLTNERNISWLVKYADNDSGTQLMAHDTEVPQTAGEPADKLTIDLLPSAQWLVCQDADGNGFAAKGGNNDENHNHNDVGHFLCVFHGEMMLTDLGAGEYTKDYFGDGRYEILCNRSSGHSVPLVNDEEQCAGKAYCADDFSWDAKENTLTISFAGAYPKGSLENLVRRIRMCDIDKTASSVRMGQRKKMQIEVQDLFKTNENTRSVSENLVTEYEPVIDNGMVWLKGLYGQCSITIDNGDDSRIKIIRCVHRDHSGKHQTVYRITWTVNVEKCSDAVCKMWITFYDR